LKSTNNSSLANALSSTTATAIAYVPFASLSAWQFPATDVSPASTISVSDLINASSQFLAGTYPSNVSSLNATFGSTNHALQLAVVVPEPSTITLGALAVLAAAGLRRRKRT
jgi:MYXO-CTERM domain-containing protein